MEETKTDPGTGIIKALAEFQSLCPPLKKDAKADVTTLKGGKYSYNYGSLPRLIEHIKPHMKKAGLTFTQPISYREGQTFLYTTLYHVETGEKIESKMLIPEAEFQGMNIFQSMGSGITYIRKYSLKSILGISEDEDDNDAAGEQKPKSKGKPGPKPKDAPTPKPEKPWLNPEVKGMVNPTWADAVRYLAADGTLDKVKMKYQISKANEEKLKNEALEYDDLPFDSTRGENTEPGGDPGPTEPTE